MTRRFAVLGDPIEHSLSPQMHNAWIADHGLDAIYERVRIEGGDAAFAAYLRTCGLAGANVTVPFKEAAARAARAPTLEVANVLTWKDDGALEAANTDGAGFCAALDEAAPGWRAARHALLIGAGGAAKGLAPLLATPERRLTILNRSVARARALAAEISGADAAEWNALGDAFAAADLIVHSTTLGMRGGPQSPAWPIARCKPGAIVVDIVYRPLETPLLKAAKARGLKAVDGLGMLIHQGALAFEIWFGVKPDTRKARERLMAILGESD